MAYEEIPDVAPAGFVKPAQVFDKIGNCFFGIFLNVTEGNYGPNWRFNTELGEVLMTITSAALTRQLNAAKLVGGELVAIQLASTKPTDKGNPMKLFKVKVDRNHSGVPPKNGPNVKLSSKPSQTVSDEIPF